MLTYFQLRIPNASRKPLLEQQPQICALHLVSTSLNPNSPWSPQMPAVQTLPRAPTSRRRYDPTPPSPRPPGSSPGCGGWRWRGLRQPLLQARAGAGGGHGTPRGIVSKIRPLRASRKQLMRPRPSLRHSNHGPMVSGAPSLKLGSCQGQSPTYEPSLGNIIRDRAHF